MAEYIEREALLKHKTLIPGFVGEYVHVDRVIEAPAADVAPVVRCKDCTHLTEQITDTVGFCSVHEDYTGADDFCNYGERKGQGE